MVSIFRNLQRPLLQILCYIFYVLVNCGVGKNRQKPRKNKLTGFDGYLYEHDRFEYHKSMTIEVRW